MNTYSVWAIQVLSSTIDIEAESVEEAQAIADKMYHDTGELDPENIVDGTCGVVGDTEWLFSTQTCGDVREPDAVRDFGAAVLTVLNAAGDDWGSDVLGELANIKQTMEKGA